MPWTLEYRYKTLFGYNKYLNYYCTYLNKDANKDMTRSYSFIHVNESVLWSSVEFHMRLQAVKGL